MPTSRHTSPMSHPVTGAIEPVQPSLSSANSPGKWPFDRPPVSPSLAAGNLLGKRSLDLPPVPAGGRCLDTPPAGFSFPEAIPGRVAPGAHAHCSGGSRPRRRLPGILPGSLPGFLPSSPAFRLASGIWLCVVILGATTQPAAALPCPAIGAASWTSSRVPPEPERTTSREPLEAMSRTAPLSAREPASRMPFHSAARSHSLVGLAAPSQANPPLSSSAAARSQSRVTAQDGRFEGRVVAPDGKPLAGVLVHQPGGVASALTDEQGLFSLRLDPAAQPRLSFSAVGYLACEVPLAGAGVVTLQPVPVYRPGFRPLAPEPGPTERPFFDTQLGLQYRARYQSVTGRSHRVEGWAGNDLAGVARLRAAPVVLGLEGFRFKAPLTLAPLAAQVSPQPTVENTQWAAWLGYPFSFQGLEWLPQAGYVTSYWVPGNQGTPWTGTPLDFGQTRQGAALALEAGRAVGALDLSARVTYIPALGTVLSGAPYSVGDLRSAEVAIGAGYEVLPGLRLGLNVARQWANGADLDEWANVFGLSAIYLPERVRP